MAAALAGPRYRSARRLRQGPRLQGVWPAASIHVRPEPTMFCLILRLAKSRPVEESAVDKRSAYVPKARFHSTAAGNPGIAALPPMGRGPAVALVIKDQGANVHNLFWKGRPVDAFEQLVSEILYMEGYWVRTYVCSPEGAFGVYRGSFL
jgi:hypothetical protein